MVCNRKRGNVDRVRQNSYIHTGSTLLEAIDDGGCIDGVAGKALDRARYLFLLRHKKDFSRNQNQRSF